MTRFFKTILAVFSSRLVEIPNLLGMPAGEDAVFGSRYTQEVSESEIPEPCREFFSKQLKLPFKDGK